VFSPHLIDYINKELHLCTNCKYDLRNSDVVAADKEVIAFQELLNNASFNNAVDSSFPLIEHTTHELFATLRAILTFFRTINRLPKHSDIFSKLKMGKFEFSTSSKKESFEAMDIRDRESMLLAVSKLFALNLDEIKKIIQESNVTYKTLTSTSSTKSKTIKYLSEKLHIIEKESVTEYHKLIKPRSKEEVEKLMDEIRPYI
jgi:hypothetical protein